VHNAPPIMRNDEEAIEYAEGERRHGEEIHRGNGFTMIVQKRRPSLCRLGIPRGFPHPALHGSFRNVEAKHLQLAVNARRSPGRVLGDHTEDQLSQFPADMSSSNAGPMPGEPFPVQLETRAMPEDYSLGLDQDQDSPPVRPQPTQNDPK
jgi:hypothetical protein